MEIRPTLISLLLLFSVVFASAQELTSGKNEAWQEGENLTYRVFYEALLTGQVNAGEATISVQPSKMDFEGRPTHHLVGIGRSKGTFNFFFKVRDRFESYVDQEHLIPYLFVRRTREGGYKKDDDVYFNQKTHMATSRDTTMGVPPNVHDFVSALYYARNLSLEQVQKDGGFKINFFLDDTTYRSFVRYDGIEVVETSMGRFRCIKLSPMAATGKVFSEKYPMSVWVTDDKNRVPILVSSAVVVGSVKMELIKFEGLKNKMEAKLE